MDNSKAHEKQGSIRMEHRSGTTHGGETPPIILDEFVRDPSGDFSGRVINPETPTVDIPNVLPAPNKALAPAKLAAALHGAGADVAKAFNQLDASAVELDTIGQVLKDATRNAGKGVVKNIREAGPAI
jgi:hypothetical protein